MQLNFITYSLIATTAVVRFQLAIQSGRPGLICTAAFLCTPANFSLSTSAALCWRKGLTQKPNLQNKNIRNISR